MSALKRLNNLPHDHHLFLFGARGTGKSTLIQRVYDNKQCLWLDLLDTNNEQRFCRDPMQLEAIVLALSSSYTHVIIHEVQKVPSLLDIVHRPIENRDVKQKFILTGSSARKLKRGGANLLAGRVFVYHLYPFSCFELADQFDLANALNWGTLPMITALDESSKKHLFLNAYANTYLKEEIWNEHLVKQLDPFRRFLEVAAQNNGKIINYRNIARDVGIDDKVVKEYYEILEDTLVGFTLSAFQHSFRKRLGTKPKFYLFDTGVVRALARLLTVPVQAGTSYYGDVFEHFVILEAMKLADYFHLDYRFSYLITQHGYEVDLVIDRPGKPYLFIEIKSTQEVNESQLASLRRIAHEFGECEAVCFSQDKYAKQYQEIRILPWQQGLKEYFTASIA